MNGMTRMSETAAKSSSGCVADSLAIAAKTLEVTIEMLGSVAIRVRSAQPAECIARADNDNGPPTMMSEAAALVQQANIVHDLAAQIRSALIGGNSL
jgi:hypothetical protein